MTFPSYQTAVGTNPPPAYPGMVADLFPNGRASGSLETVADWGLGLVRGPTASLQAPLMEDFVKVPTVTGAKFMGVVIADGMRMPQPGSASRYAAKDTVSYLRKGRIWVPINGDVTQDAAAFFVFTTGFFRADSTGADAVPTGVFLLTTTVAGLAMALLEINLP